MNPDPGALAELPIDGQALAVLYARQVNALTELVADRIGTAAPPDFPSSGPCLVITLVSNRPSDGSGQHLHLQEPHLQLWALADRAGAETEAFAIAAAALKAFLDLPLVRPVADGIVVTGTRVALGITQADDPPTGCAGYRSSVILTAHRAQA